MKKFKILMEEIFKKGGKEIEYVGSERRDMDKLHKSGIRLSRRRKSISSFSVKRIRRLAKRGQSRHGIKKKR
jgi:hypothetical protein